jgi:hypothetical protein
MKVRVNGVIPERRRGKPGPIGTGQVSSETRRVALSTGPIVASPTNSATLVSVGTPVAGAVAEDVTSTPGLLIVILRYEGGVLSTVTSVVATSVHGSNGLSGSIGGSTYGGGPPSRHNMFSTSTVNAATAAE